jgi:hypothetical protein
MSRIIRANQSQPTVLWVMLLAILLVYLSFPTKNYYWDGIDFAHTIESASRVDTSLVHPNHLIYNLVGYLFYKLLRGMVANLRAVAALQILNSLLSASCAYVLFLILKSSLRSLYVSLCLTLLFAFSATWWRFSTDADAYVPSVLFLLISFYLILPNRKPKPFLVALTFSVAMCFHQLAILFGPVIVLGLFLQTESRGLKERIITVFEFGAPAFLLTVGAYYLCFHLASGRSDLVSFLHWTTSFSPEAGGFSFNLGSDMAYTLRGHARLFLGGRINLIKGLVNPLIGLLMFVLVVVIVLFTYVVLTSFSKPSLRWLRSLQRDQQHRKLVLLSLSWFLVYLIFLFFWIPQNTFYRLFYLPALIVLAGVVVKSSTSHGAHERKYRLALFVAAVSLANFLFLIFPYSHEEKYPPLAFAREMSKAWPAGTVVYYAMDNSDNSLVRYFNPATNWKSLDSLKPPAWEKELHDIYSKGAAAWLDYSAIDRLSSTPDGAAWLSRHAKQESRRELVNQAFKIRFVQIGPDTR